MTAGEKVAKTAQKYIGVSESPPGSNRGRPYPEKWQAPWGMGTGWPWCAAYAHAMYTESIVDDDGIGHPSTAVMYERAKSRPGSIITRPMPGCYILWPGKHVGIVVRDLGGNVALTVEGNSGESVAYRKRAYGPGTGVVFVAPAAVRRDYAPQRPRREYYLQDPGAENRYYGPWRSRDWRENAIAKHAGGRPVRRVRDGKKYGFFLGDPPTYGPWVSDEDRNNARKILEDRLGRRLRPFSRPVPTAPAGPVDAIGKTT
jgi:hypothetical protein